MHWVCKGGERERGESKRQREREKERSSCSLFLFCPLQSSAITCKLDKVHTLLLNTDLWHVSDLLCVCTFMYVCVCLYMHVWVCVCVCVLACFLMLCVSVYLNHASVSQNIMPISMLTLASYATHRQSLSFWLVVCMSACSHTPGGCPVCSFPAWLPTCTTPCCYTTRCTTLGIQYSAVKPLSLSLSSAHTHTHTHHAVSTQALECL